MTVSFLREPWASAHRLVNRTIGSPALRNGTFALIACVCVALIGVEAWQLWRVYETNIERADIVSSNTARSVAEQVELTLQTADTVVASLVAQVEAEGTSPEALTRFYRLMSSLAQALPAIHEMGIIDSQGNAIAKSLTRDTHGLNYAERTYFAYHATHPDRGPFIGARVQSKIDGAYSITVTRRINNPDGSFGGVAVTSVSLSYFQQFFDRLQAESGGVISLLADDGSILARSPHPPVGITNDRKLSVLRQMMRDQPEAGNTSYISAIDGDKRRGSYQHIRHFPVIAVVSQSDWDVQSSWRSELRSHMIILACVMVVLVVLGRRAMEATRLLAAQAMQDGLTGLPNRRSFDAALTTELRRAERSGQPLSLILIDIDHFKAYNDSYGHPAGDECIRAVARAIQGCLRRAGEVAARYGGEEIAVILPGTNAARATDLAEAMQQAVRDLALRQAPAYGGNVTFSGGIATCEGRRCSVGPEGLLSEADGALYAAKAAGRNIVLTSRRKTLERLPEDVMQLG